MLSLEECKKHIGHFELDDKKIEEIRDLLTVFVTAVLDFTTDPDTVVLGKENEKE